MRRGFRRGKTTAPPSTGDDGAGFVQFNRSINQKDQPPLAEQGLVPTALVLGRTDRPQPGRVREPVLLGREQREPEHRTDRLPEEQPWAALVPGQEQPSEHRP